MPLDVTLIAKLVTTIAIVLQLQLQRKSNLVTCRDPRLIPLAMWVLEEVLTRSLLVARKITTVAKLD